MNENVIKAIDAIESAIAIEQSKIAKMVEMRNDWANKYVIKCNGCLKENIISKYTRIKKYDIDMDSDWHYYGEEYDKFGCPECNCVENWVTKEILRLMKFFTIKFKDTKDESSKW